MGPFLDANAPQLRRLDVRPEVRTAGGVRLVLHPGSRIGAIPLLSPSRAKWLQDCSSRRGSAGRRSAPSPADGLFRRAGIGRSPAVPGSAREVPPWILAVPVLRRSRRCSSTNGAASLSSARLAPRPRTHRLVDVGDAARATRATRPLPLRVSRPQFDPSLRAQMRWTVRRLLDSLAMVADSLVGRALIEKAVTLDVRLGDGPISARKPRQRLLLCVRRRGSASDGMGRRGARPRRCKSSRWAGVGPGGGSSLGGLGRSFRDHFGAAPSE